MYTFQLGLLIVRNSIDISYVASHIDIKLYVDRKTIDKLKVYNK